MESKAQSRHRSETHTAAIRREFAKQAPSFEDPKYSFADPRLLRWILDHLPYQPDDVVLDVAAGTGHVARALAPHVRQVVAIDLTEAMLAAGWEEARRASIENVLFHVGDAAALPYLDDSFDLVVSRFAVHHFEDPRVQLREMARVCRPGREVAIIDMVSPEDELADVYNGFERLRDPTHVRALTHEELTRSLDGAALSVMHCTAQDQILDLDRWLDQAQANPDAAREIRSAVTGELAGGAPSGMRPLERDGRVSFTQRWEIVVAGKPLEAASAPG